MTTAEARQLVQKTFQNPFDKGQFVYFIKNLVNEIDEEKAFHARGYVHEKYRDRVKTYERIGTYTDPEDNKVDILIIYLQKESSIDRARTTLRNFVGDYLKERGEKEAGLIAFVSPNEKDWRFSLVKMEYKITETPSGRIKAKEEFTPAKRYSFLVGVEETSHTAQSRLVPILEDDAENPTLKSIEEAFNIEKVTKEFFEKYRDLYLRVKETLDDVLKNDKAIKADFAGKNIDTVDFGKKLLGQIVFLYFLQKKGWFGVKRGEAWGSGSKNFLRELFDKKHGGYKNFFNDILEPLFYEALRNDRSHDDHYFSMFKCKIPFLNGGLFDPINNYDWKETDVILPNDLFSNSYKTKEGDIGTGILDIFDRYNFTVKEDEPLEKEVAVDPEMLGKVFENLLEVKDRKSKGTYYTPREIVHYMCQESLVNYLATELDKKVNKKDIETLIKYGETVVEHEAEVESRGKETKTYSHKLSKAVRDNAKLIDEKLETIRICDPAVGSGAFPVGMMNEIIRTRNALTSYLKTKKGRTIYDFKRHAIQNCLYGVDIDLGAVEIAKLRLWLSLIVDEEDIKQIKPLPNLDYKIVQGNSLLGVEQNLFNQPLFTKLEELKPLFFNETNARKKQEYKKQIDNLISQITNNNQNFDFEIYFSEVFHDKKGFDVVIANPPYVNIENLDDNLKKYLFQKYEACSGRTDIYIAFIEMSIKILRNKGSITYIIPYAFTNQKYGANLRKLLVEKLYVKEILDTSEYLIFENAVVRNIVLQVIKSEADSNTIIKLATSEENFNNHNFKVFSVDQKEFLNFKDYRFETKNILNTNVLKQKIVKDSTKLSDICFIAYGARLNHRAKAIRKEAYIFKEFQESLKPYHEGKNIERYKLSQFGWLKYVPAEHYNPMFSELFENEKLVSINVVKDKLRFALDKNKFYNSHTVLNIVKWHLLQEVTHSSVKRNITREKIEFSKGCDYKFLLAILNSKLINWYFINFLSEKLHFYPEDARSLPIKNILTTNQKQLIGFVNKILAITNDADYLENPTKQTKVRDYEKQIDQLVYKLYGLTPEDIKIVENEK